MENSSPARAKRAELYAALDGYLAALQGRDPERCRWADTVLNTENNVALRVGDGLWGTITGLGSYDLRFADMETGQVGFFGSVTETHDESPLTVRLKVVGGRIVEAETIVVRAADSGLKFPDPRFDHKPSLHEILEPSQRVPRERMISLADGYFDTLQLNDGTIFTRIHGRSIEVHVFPPGVKAGEGHYRWSLRKGSMMTNGTVGKVTASPGGRVLLVSYPHGERRIVVPKNVPVVEFTNGDRALLKPGIPAFLIVARAPSGKLVSSGIAIGENGARPPM